MLLEAGQNIGVVALRIIDFPRLVELDPILAQNVQEMLGLFFQFIWAFDYFLDHVGVAQVFEAVVDVAALLVLTEKSLCAREESILNLG